MKRSSFGPRYAPLRSKRTIRKVNPERQAKRRIRQAAKHRAYMRSETRKIVDARASGRCEASVMLSQNGLVVAGVSAIPCNRYRCQNAATAHHHLTYARYGGNELPEDILKVCRRCHDWLEREHPTRQSHLRQTGRARQDADRG